MPPTLMRSSSKYLPNGTGCLTRTNPNWIVSPMTMKKGPVCLGLMTTPFARSVCRVVEWPGPVAPSGRPVVALDVGRSERSENADHTSTTCRRDERLWTLVSAVPPHSVIYAVGVRKDQTDSAGDVHDA